MLALVRVLYSVSGQLLTGTIPSQFDKAIGVGPVKVVIMDVEQCIAQ